MCVCVDAWMCKIHVYICAHVVMCTCMGLGLRRIYEGEGPLFEQHGAIRARFACVCACVCVWMCGCVDVQVHI